MGHEFDLIEQIRRRAEGSTHSDALRVGIGDDAAVVAVRPENELVCTCDSLVAGVHFLEDADPRDLGHKAAAVNLSDLAAMGAEPRWLLLSLTLPEPDAAWVTAFIDGLCGLAESSGARLIGGDTAAGPLTLTVTALGEVPSGQALRRAGAREGDQVMVSGSLGDAALALDRLRRGLGDEVALRSRLDRPTPRIALGVGLRGLATACIDVSDGLLADLGHLCRLSGVGATIDLDALPLSEAFLGAGGTPEQAASGGDDYELCFTAPPEHVEAILGVATKAGVTATVVGEIVAGEGVVPRRQGRVVRPERLGYRHFG